MKTILVISLVTILAACANTGIVPMEPGVYMLSKDTAKFGGGLSMTVRAEVYQEANAFCSQKGKFMETQDLTMIPGRPGQLGNVTLQFRCSSNSTGQATRLRKEADQVIEIHQK